MVEQNEMCGCLSNNWCYDEITGFCINCGGYVTKKALRCWEDEEKRARELMKNLGKG